MSRVEVVGGPFDGLDVREGPVFAWVGERVTGGTVYGVHRAGRALYRLVVSGGRRAYVFAGHSHRRCMCGAWLRNPEGGRDRAACVVCGAPPERATGDLVLP